MLRNLCIVDGIVPCRIFGVFCCFFYFVAANLCRILPLSFLFEVFGVLMMLLDDFSLNDEVLFLDE